MLPSHSADQVSPDSPAKGVTKVALRLKYQIEQVIPHEVDERAITDPNSHIITKAVIETAKQAGGDDLQESVVFCLLVCLRWFRIQAVVELWDSDLNECKAVACEVIAKHMYEIRISFLELVADAQAVLKLKGTRITCLRNAC